MTTGRVPRHLSINLLILLSKVFIEVAIKNGVDASVAKAEEMKQRVDHGLGAFDVLSNDVREYLDHEAKQVERQPGHEED